jgi:hypothetical protein
MDITKIKNKYSHTLYDNAIKARLAYFKRVKDELDAHKAKHGNIILRKKMLDNQTKNNYQLEYDRIRGDFEVGSVMNGRTRRHLEDRKRELERLGATAINAIQ